MYGKGFESLINNYTRVQQNNKSCIDHIFIKIKTQNKEKITPIILTSNITDHYATLVAIEKQELDSQEKKEHYFEKVNYKQITQELSNQNWSYFYETRDCEEASNILINNFKAAIQKATKKITLKNIKKRKKWITRGLITSIENRDKMYQDLLKQPLNENLKQQYKIYRNKVNSLIKKTKKDYYEKQIENNNHCSKTLWKITQEIIKSPKQNQEIKQIKLPNNHVVNDKKQIVNEFNKHYAEVGNKLANKIHSPNKTFPIVTTNNSFFLTPVDDKEIVELIKELKNNKAPGIDGITSEMLKETINIMTPLLVSLINKIFQSGVCPSNFKIAIIKPLYKKGEKNLMENYRPISLTSNIAKIFEKALKKRLVQYLNKFKLLSVNQYGFREKTSTSDAIAYLTKKFYECLDNNTPSLCVFIDLEKAFDTISHKKILKKLENFGIRGLCHSLLKSYLDKRTQVVKIGNHTSETRNVLYGLPQGTVLAPILFIMYLNDIFSLNIRGDVVSFADDTAIFFKGKSWEDVKRISEMELKTIKDWFDENTLTLNIKKTKYLPFCSYKNNLPLFTEINIVNTNLVINTCEKINYLGITLDSHLKWNHHITNTVKKLRSLLYRFKKLKETLNQKHIKIIYYGMIESILKYGIIAWGGANKTNIKPLILIQKLYLKILYGKPYLYPSELIYKESDLLNIRELYSHCLLIHQYKTHSDSTLVDHSYNTRGKDRKQVKVTVAQKTIGTKCFTYLGPRLYNNLPESIKQIRSIIKYKREVKKWLTNIHYTLIDIFIDTGNF